MRTQLCKARPVTLLRHLLTGCIAMCISIAAGSSVVRAQAINEGFDNVPMLTGAGWVMQNLSQPAGTTGWFQGTLSEFGAFSPAGTTSYLAANFDNAGNGAGADIISNWLMSPLRTFNNGDQISFYTRSSNPRANTLYTDRLQVRLSESGASTNAGGAANTVGDFSTLLLDINEFYAQGSQYPDSWTQYDITISGLSGPTPGRFAFRYFVEDGGPAGQRSNYIGIDSLEYTPVPEPATLALLSMTLLIARRRRSRR